MRRNQRTIAYYDIITRPGRSTGAPSPTMKEIADALLALHSAKMNGRLARDQNNLFYQFGDIEIDNTKSLLKILITRCDMMAADAAYRNIKTNGQKIHKKHPDEGGETAAHLVISLKAEKGRPNCFLAILETVNGISPIYIEKLFNLSIMRAKKESLYTFKYPHPFKLDANSKPSMLEYMPKVSMHGHMSEDFIRDLEEGTLKNIQLIEEKAHKPIGGNLYLTENRSVLKIGVKKEIPSKGRLNAVKAALNQYVKNKVNYSTARLAFVDPKGKSQTVDFSIERGTIMPNLAIKTKLLDHITPSLDSSAERIVPHFANLLVKELLTERSV